MLPKCRLRSPGVETRKEVSVQWMWTNPAWSLAVVTFSSRNTREMSYSSIQTPQLFFLSVCKQKFRNNSDVPWCPVHMYTHTHTHKGGWGGVGVQTALQFQAIPAKEQKKKVCFLACKKTDGVVNRDFCCCCWSSLWEMKMLEQWCQFLWQLCDGWRSGFL